MSVRVLSSNHSQVTGNYRSKPGYTKPFIEVALSQAVDMAGLEVTTFGAANIRRFEKDVVLVPVKEIPALRCK